MSDDYPLTLVDELTLKNAALERELSSLRRWKQEAMIVLGQWHDVADMVPKTLGRTLSSCVRAELERLREIERVARMVAEDSTEYWRLAFAMGDADG